MSFAPSRLLFGLVPWYSFLIVFGAAVAIFLAVREEKYAGMKKDTALDFALIALPCGIIGARIYYVAFSWPKFRNNMLSVLKIWEGGIAIYGAVIAGLLAAWVFSRKRKISFFTLCDLFAPGLILAQAIGRWGNYFNQEAYGVLIRNPSLQFFPFGVQIQTESGLQWHMATFFYESVWNLTVFFFLICARRRWFRYHGDVISFYAFLYACGRFVIEDFRTDSLYASSSVRISQLLSIIFCILILVRYLYLFRPEHLFPLSPVRIVASFALFSDLIAILWIVNLIHFAIPSLLIRFFFLLLITIFNTVSLFILYGSCSRGELIYANHKS